MLVIPSNNFSDTSGSEFYFQSTQAWDCQSASPSARFLVITQQVLGKHSNPSDSRSERPGPKCVTHYDGSHGSEWRVQRHSHWRGNVLGGAFSGIYFGFNGIWHGSWNGIWHGISLGLKRHLTWGLIGFDTGFEIFWPSLASCFWGPSGASIAQQVWLFSSKLI